MAGVASDSKRSTFVGLSLLLVGLTLTTMSPIVANEFVNWDDTDQITQNPDFNRPGVAPKLLEYWTRTKYVGSLFPLSYNMIGIEAIAAQRPGEVGGPAMLDPVVFHIVSLVLHALSAVVVFWLLRRLDLTDAAAAAGAAFFAVHPVQVENVAWASSQNTLLSGLLALAAVWQYICYERSTMRANRRAHYTFATALYILALLAKSSAMVVPIVVLIVGRVILRQRWKTLAIAVGPWLVLALPAVAVSRAMLTSLVRFPSPLGARPMIALDALSFYFTKGIAPIWLAMDYGRSPRYLLATAERYWTWIIAASIITAAVWAVRRWPRISAGVGIFVAALLPVLGLIPFDFQKYSTVSDRYLYVSMAGAGLLVAALLQWSNRRTAYVAAWLLILALAGRTYARTRDWHDSLTLCQSELRANPHSVIAQEMTAATLAGSGQSEAAIPHYEAALALNPGDPKMEYDLGNALMATHQPQAAARHYQAAVSAEPTNLKARNNLAVALARLGRLDDARAQFEEILRQQPTSEVARAGLAKLRSLQAPASSRSTTRPAPR